MKMLGASLRKTLLDLHEWMWAYTPEFMVCAEPGVSETPPMELIRLVGADPRLDALNNAAMADLMVRLVEWQYSAGVFNSECWRAAEMHAMYQRILSPALEGCLRLEMAYLVGGGSEIDWEDVDDAREHAQLAVKASGLKGFRTEDEAGCEVAIVLAVDESSAIALANGLHNGSAVSATPHDDYEECAPAAGTPRP